MDQENSASRQMNSKGKEEKRYLMHLETTKLRLPSTRMIRALNQLCDLFSSNVCTQFREQWLNRSKRKQKAPSSHKSMEEKSGHFPSPLWFSLLGGKSKCLPLLGWFCCVLPKDFSSERTQISLHTHGQVLALHENMREFNNTDFPGYPTRTNQ